MEAGGVRRGAVALLSVTAAVSCFLLAAQLSGAGAGGRVGLLSVLGINLGFFAELRVGQYAPGFPTGGDVQWLNSKPLDIKELQANDEWVLIHFWDSTSAESLRTLPYVKKMHEYYGKHGLQVVGVHRPRYDFARSLVLLADAVRRLEIEYPVVNDVDADVAHAYGAKQLDTMYLINDDNLIVGRKRGREAGPIMMSSVCKALASKNPALACLPAAAVQTSLSSSAPAASADADAARQSLYTNYYGNPNHPRAGHRCRPATADVFVGEARASDLDVGTTAGRGSLTHLQSYAGLLQRKHYSDMSGVQLDDGAFVLSGDWTTHKEGMVATADAASGFVNTHLRLRYHAKAVYALMGLAAAEEGSMHMCTDGKSGNAAAGTACVQGEACQDLAGPVGLYGWCHAEAAEGQQASQWGGCTPCSKLEAVKVYLLLDGVPVPRQRRGKDVEEDAFGRTFVSVREPRLYLLISDTYPAARGLQLLPAQQGVAVNQFSFASNCDADLPALT